MALPGRLIYPIYPDVERFRQDWWQFAAPRDGFVHGWGTVIARDGIMISPYQVARLIARQATGTAVPLIGWGLGDLLADRQAAVDSHAHARLFLDRTGLPPVASIVHQVDFSQALPGAYAQSVSFLAFLVEARGMAALAAFARSGGERWYDFSPLFERAFGIPLPEADRLWRRRLAGVRAPTLSDQEFNDYRQAAQFACGIGLARDPAGLVSRPGGAAAYLEGMRAAEALRRFDVAAATGAALRGRQGLERAQRNLHRTRLAVRTAIWGLAVLPIALAVLLLAAPSLRSAWRDWRRRRRQRNSRRRR